MRRRKARKGGANGAAKTAVTGKAARPERIVSYEMMSVILRAWQDWVWGGYRGKACAIKVVAEGIALTRQGLTKVLRRKGDSKLTTFLKTCFLKPGTECGITVEVEGWKFELRWQAARSNGSCLCDGGKSA